MLGIPTQWDVQSFCDELKSHYKTIIKSERLYIRGGRLIPKIRVDFSSSQELSMILKNKSMVLDDENRNKIPDPKQWVLPKIKAPPREMNPNAKEFFPDHTEALHLCIDYLLPKQAEIFRQLALEWSTTPALNCLFDKWEKDRQNDN